MQKLLPLFVRFMDKNIMLIVVRAPVVETLSGGGLDSITEKVPSLSSGQDTLTYK